VKPDLNSIGDSRLLHNQLARYRVLKDFVFDNAVESDRVHQSRASALSAGQWLAS
jgi:hypothetical protein